MTPVVPMVEVPVAIVAPRPEVQVNAWAVVIPAVPVSRAVPMAAMPVATVAHLLNACALARHRFETSRHAGCGRSLRRRRDEPERKRRYS
jgi:hypothetical protein